MAELPEFDPARARTLAEALRNAGTAFAMICYTLIFLAWIGTGLVFALAVAGKVEQRTFSNIFTTTLLLTPILGVFGRYVDLSSEVKAMLLEEHVRDSAAHASDADDSAHPNH